MDPFRLTRQRLVEEIATEASRGDGPSKRRRGSIGLGVLALLIFVIAMLIVGSDRSMDDVDGLCIEYRVVAEDGDVSPETLEQVRIITENRVHTLGVDGPIVRSRRSDRIEVALPGIESGTEEADQALELIGATGVLEFMPVPPELQGLVGEGPLPDGMQDVEPLFTGVEIASAAIAQDGTTGEIVVDLQLTETGARLFAQYAADHYGDQFAIVLDGEVMVAPTIQATRFGGRAQISGGEGGFTSSEAQALVTVLRFGALPLGLTDVRTWACGGPRDVAGASQRIEVPEVGIALTYPAGWDVAVAPWDPLDADRDLLGWYQVMAHGPDGAEYCDLYTWRKVGGSDVSLDEETQAFIESVRADPETELLPTTETHVLLPATDASRVDFEGHGDTYSYWHAADGAFLHQLACHAPTAPEDHWRSIADTLELIAVEP